MYTVAIHSLCLHHWARFSDGLRYSWVQLVRPCRPFIDEVRHTCNGIISFSQYLLHHLLSLPCLKRELLLSFTSVICAFVIILVVVGIMWTQWHLIVNIVECLRPFHSVEWRAVWWELLLELVHPTVFFAFTHVVPHHHPVFFAERNVTKMCSNPSFLQFYFETFTQCLFSIHFLDCFFSGLCIIVTYEAVSFWSSILFISHDAYADNCSKFERLEEIEQI